jgi:hypothetical protein
VWPEASGDDEVRAGQRLGLILDPERLDLLPDVVVCEVFLGVGEAGPGLAIDEQLSVAQAMPSAARTSRGR